MEAAVGFAGEAETCQKGGGLQYPIDRLLLIEDSHAVDFLFYRPGQKFLIEIFDIAA